MPGGHRHFQFWFTPLYPLLISMLGLPCILTCPLPDYFYPILHGGNRPLMNLQHKVLLGIVGWLITVGPRDDILYDVLKFSEKRCGPLKVVAEWWRGRVVARAAGGLGWQRKGGEAKEKKE